MRQLAEKAYSFGRDHWFIVLNALVMAFLVFAPVIFYPFADRTFYRGINAGNFAVDEFQYMAKGREILEGHRLGNFVLREGKDWYNIQQTYVEYVLMAPIQLLGLPKAVNVATVFHVYGFLGVALLVALIYFFVLQLSADKRLASLIALFVVGGYTFVTLYPIQFSAFGHNLNVYSRPVIPVFSSVTLFIYLNLLVKALRSPRWRYAVLAGGSFGLLFYVYFYTWTYALALTGSLFLIYALKRDFLKAKKVFALTAFGITIGSYMLSQLALIHNSDIGRQIFSFLATYYGRQVVFSKILFFTSVLFAVFVYFRKRNEAWPILLAIILAGWLSLNQQVVTGRTMEEWHYFWYFVIPMSIVVSLYAVWFLVPAGFYRKLLFVGLCVALYANIAVRQYYGFLDTAPAKRYAQNYRPIIDSLNNDSGSTVVLSSDPIYQYLFVVYTPHDLFWGNTAPAFNTPMERVKDALYVYAYLNRNSRNDFFGYIDRAMQSDDVDDRSYTVIQDQSIQDIYFDIENYTFYEMNDGRENYVGKWLTDDPAVLRFRERTLSRLSDEYNAIVKNQNGILNVLKKYNVNYIVWDKNMSPEWDLSVLGRLEEVTSSNNIYLYRLAY